MINSMRDTGKRCCSHVESKNMHFIRNKCYLQIDMRESLTFSGIISVWMTIGNGKIPQAAENNNAEKLTMEIQE